ncbi:heme-binding protein [Rhizobium laguerreae]|uniref:GlcG/HbpS family heme-binding protein n=1 Tax=Rhizobium laguerreae TaxID=1076926 RepID=UPI001C90B43A|nr:heme-binding protein [Rhizobium laguerreae]MBY3416320.1 heme-binding protein [Rhizobium laguerreae]
MPMLQETLGLDDAAMAVKAALAQAEVLGVACSVAIVDAGGHLIAFARRDRARIATVELAINKAFSARIFDTGTAELGALAKPGAELYGIQHSHDGRSIIFGGGLPIRSNGMTIGAVGVSGGSVQQDVDIASAAISLYA